MTLIVEAHQRLGSFELDAGFTVGGGVTALFGRSGSGKTSLIRMIAGLSAPDRGRLLLDDDVLVDTGRRIFVPKHRRRFGYVFQDARLFPHLTVRQNLHYGRWFAGRREARAGGPASDAASFERIVEMLGIAALLDRHPGRLSGGERQRVAIGRALLSAPRLLLMDEPLAALDEERKAEILPYLETLRDETATPIIYVSHSVAEVARLADEVVLVDAGRVKAVGAPAEVLEGVAATPDRRDGGAVLAGVVTDIDAHHGLSTVSLSAAQVIVPHTATAVGKAVRLYLPERDVMVATRRPEGLSALNIIEGVLQAISTEVDGTARLRIRSGADIILSRITALSVERLALQVGMPIFAIVKTVALQR